MKDHLNGASDQKSVWLKYIFFSLIFTHYTCLYKLQQWCQKSDVNLRFQCWKFVSCKQADCQSLFIISDLMDMRHKYKQITKMVISHRYLLYYMSDLTGIVMC